MNISSHAWIDQVLGALGARAVHRFDIANIHVRAPAAQVGPTVINWRHFFSRLGFHGPLWVTETGYPADPAFQTDPSYQNRPASQARWMTSVIPAMLHSGAAMVFLTERDTLTGRYASEGILQSTDPLTADVSYTLRPSYYAVRALAKREPTAATSRHKSRGHNRRHRGLVR